MTTAEARALEVARSLIDLGVPVFAAPPDPSESTGYRLPRFWQATPADPRYLDVWRPGWALAAVCGHGLDVLDTDPRSGGGESRAGLNGNAPRVYGLASTPSGGTHEWIASLGVHKGTLAPGLDLQSGTAEGGRGFVFIPPTVRTSKTDGVARPYVWIRPPTRPEPGDDSGAGLRAMLAAKRAETAGGQGMAGASGEPIPMGEHDATLAAYAAARAARGDSFEEVVALVVRRGQDCVPPWAGPDSLEHCARTRWVPSAMRKFSRPYEPPGPGLSLVGAPEVAPPVEVARARFLDWHALANEPPEAVEWLVPGLIAARRGTALYSTTGVGKSILLLELAVAVACGRPVLGAAASQRTVLYVDHENDPRGDVWYRLSCMGVEPDDLDALRYMSFPDMAALDSPAGGAALLEVALEVGAALVVVDTASRTVRGPENDNDTWNAWDRNTGVKLKAAGIAFVRLDHAGKDAERGQRGGSGKGTDVDLVWRLEKSGEDGEFVLTNEKDRTPVPDKVIAFRRVTSPRLHSVRISASDVSVRLRAQRAAWEALDEAGLPVDAGRDAARAVLREAGIRVENAVLAAVIKARKAQNNAFATRPEWAPRPVEGSLSLVRNDENEVM